jgi:hypothetical protein
MSEAESFHLAEYISVADVFFDMSAVSRGDEDAEDDGKYGFFRIDADGGTGHVAAVGAPEIPSLAEGDSTRSSEVG